MVLQTICHLQGKLVCKTPPLASPTTVVQIRHWEPMQGLMRLARASHGLTCEVCMPSTRTTCEPRPRLIPTLARCARPAASPDTHVHACSDVVARIAPSCPHPPDMHGWSVLNAHGLTGPPACLPSPRRLTRRARTQPALVFPTDVHAPARLRAHCRTHCTALTLALVLSRPLPHYPSSDVVTTTTRRSCCRDRHAVVVTTRPPRPGPPSPAHPSCSRQRRGDDNDTLIATASSLPPAHLARATETW
jgi:hypothetical protein